jgi:hypothetical protein
MFDIGIDRVSIAVPIMFAGVTCIMFHSILIYKTEPELNDLGKLELIHHQQANEAKVSNRLFVCVMRMVGHGLSQCGPTDLLGVHLCALSLQCQSALSSEGPPPAKVSPAQKCCTEARCWLGERTPPVCILCSAKTPKPQHLPAHQPVQSSRNM